MPRRCHHTQQRICRDVVSIHDTGYAATLSAYTHDKGYAATLSVELDLYLKE